MRASQLRGAMLCARRYLRVAASACALGLLLTACGGSDSANTSSSADLPVTVTGADGASVHLRQIQRDSAQQATIRVARDSTGAPALNSSFKPLGPIYQYTPHGWLEDEIELRVPFQAEGNVVPRLMVAQPGGRWSEVANARLDGSFMVGRVLQLGYATVVTTAEGSSFSGRISALAARARSLTGTQTDPALSISVGNATAPALPAPQDGAWPKVTAQTNLVLDVAYNLPACSVAPEAEVVGMTWQGNLQNIRYVNLGRRALSGVNGTAVYSMPLTEAENGNWVFQAFTWCKEPQNPEVTYSKSAYSEKFTVDIAGTTPIPAPVIASHPADIAVMAGTSANFVVAAQGSSLGYEWQRSSDGGLSYGAVPGATSATYSLTTALGDNGALFRVRVTNASGTVVSTPALLTVTPVVIAPAVTTDPSNQSVLEGDSATFTVAGTGQPAPTIQWQQRAAGATSPEEGWSDVAGATGNSYTALSLTTAQNGTQFRAVLRNSAGIAASLAATVTVTTAATAPSIVSAPQPRTVTAGQFGLFSVTAGGTTPLSYQWFRNGQALVGENASEVLVFADPADAGSSYQITVQISNPAGTITSPAVAMSVNEAGTLVSAAEGGTVASTDGSSLSIPPGALMADTTVSVTSEAVSPSFLPVDVLGLSDAIEIRPPGLQFGSPVALTFKVSTDIPTGMVIAFVDVSDAPSGLSVRPVASARIAGAGSNLRRDAARGVTTLAKIAAIGNVFIPASGLRCSEAQNVNTAGEFPLNGITSAIRKMAVAVPLARCASVEPMEPTEVPRDTDQACTTESQFANANGDAGLINRHVQCVSAIATNQDFSVDLELASTNPDTGITTWRHITNPRTFTGSFSSFTVGRADIETQLSISGPSNTLSKKFRARHRLLNFERVNHGSQNSGPFNPTSIKVKPVFGCSQGSNGSATCTYDAPAFVSVPTSGAWSQFSNVDVRFDWVRDTNQVLDIQDISPNSFRYDNAIDGAEFERPNGNDVYSFFSGVSSLYPLRCDRGVAQVGTAGCVFPAAAAVYVLSRADGSVKEAAEHVLEAQTGPRQAPGRFLLRSGTRAIADSSVTGSAALQRAKALAVQEENRKQSCTLATSLYRTRLPLNQSANCVAGTQRCSCDEYPFASTWSGGRFIPDHTSAKNINFDHNQNAGSGRLTNFYLKERVLDFTQYPEQVQPYDPSAESNRGGDDFWVYVK